MSQENEKCLDCGRYVCWFVDSVSGNSDERKAIWGKVSEGNKFYYLCPTCFILRSTKLGINVGPWRLTPFCDPEAEISMKSYSISDASSDISQLVATIELSIRSILSDCARVQSHLDTLKCGSSTSLDGVALCELANAINGKSNFRERMRKIISLRERYREVYDKLTPGERHILGIDENI